MALLIVAMLLVVALGVAIVGVVALPAHREGRDVLTDRGESVAKAAAQRVGSVATEVRERTHVRARTH
ncbi:hypothetical protein [Terracoccus luteus]|jgi:cell shape-determining protein MreC|uniref:Cell shape-determining protein MreC n=1 Tax=Terracoccus luteus TaxID=53356 RepID=A0A495XXB0_9MICO|nr:hypothetical protein [Terracoccus luteus]MBB2985267.1 cell shape-determining protein MreC [Terracoccus luteus]MCP2170919.1 cell shape-determining protein MreC [Terracoccus luteus]RKT77474.1 hypothetical protein DFJ68_0897 [Terracoccus luteus]